MRMSRKKYIRNMPIRQKMLAALTACVIIPIVLLGFFTITRVARLSERNQYEVQLNQLTRSAKDVENLYNEVVQEAAALAGSDAVQAITTENASVMDYKNAAEKMVTVSETIEGCSNITISKNGQVLFQRGNRYRDEELEENWLNEEIMYSKWFPSHPVTFAYGIHSATRKQIVYCTSIFKNITLEEAGMISIYIDVEEMMEEIVPYSSEGMMHNALLIDDSGLIMATRSEDPIDQKCWDAFSENQENGQKESGYFALREGRQDYIVIYTKCGASGWYLFQIEHKITYYNEQIIFVIAAVFLCIIFGMVYGVIQNQTMIMPLKHLSNRIDAVKKGILEQKDYETVHDEIGNVEAGFEDMVAHINKLINQVYIQTIKKQEAEREMLLAKMNPHFLYNSLDSIHWLAFRNKDYEVSEQLEALADVYRHILRFGEDLIPLKDEMEFIDNYLFLLDFQMGDRIKFFRDVPENLLEYKFPKLMIQPLIENSVQHGLKNTKAEGKVKLRIRKKENKLIVTVVDNGVGCNEGEIQKLLKETEGMRGFALRNIEQRVKLRYGEEYGLTIRSQEGQGCIARIIIGLENQSDENDDC